MTPLIVCLPYCRKDVEQARELLLWINELDHPAMMPAIIMAADHEVDRATVMQLKSLAAKSFSFVRTILVPTKKEGWPPNQMFLETAKVIQHSYRFPFLWIEPDCVPLKPDWYFQIELAYNECPKKFMGPIIRQDKDASLPKEHLTGCSVYPQDAYDWFSPITVVTEGKTPWDIAGADKVVRAAVNTDLIYHVWGTHAEPPTFVVQRSSATPRNAMVRSDIPQSAVLFHRSKDGSLLRILRGGLDGTGVEGADGPSSPPASTVPKTPVSVPPVTPVPAVSEVE